jgi:hypothetical protein
MRKFDLGQSKNVILFGAELSIVVCGKRVMQRLELDFYREKEGEGATTAERKGHQ